MSGLEDLDDLLTPIPASLEAAMTVSRQQQQIDVDGCPINYFSWGQPGLPGLLFLHGRMSHARCWAFVAPLLSHRFHCVALDSSGMGDSGWRDSYTYQNRIDELIAVADHAGMASAEQSPVLVSHSFGAVIAVKAMLQNLGVFKGLVACDPSLTAQEEWPDLKPREETVSARDPSRTYPDLATAISRYRYAPSQPVTQPALTEYLARHSLKAVPGGWQWKFDPGVYSAREEGHDDWWIAHSQEFVSLDAPKAILYGAASDFLTAEVVQKTASAGNIRVPYAAIANAHHHLMADQPEALATGIEAMFEAIQRG